MIHKKRWFIKGGDSPLTRRLFAVLLILVLLFYAGSAFSESEEIPQPTLSPDADPYDADHPEDLSENQLYALSAILMTQKTGDIIFEKDAYTLRYPASTTKILTVLLGIMMVDDLQQTVEVSETAMNIPADSSTMNLHAGEQIRYIDVLYGTMMLSGNDGANVIAETVSGSIPAFVNLMNETAVLFGCENTHFVNAHGYHDDNHYTTAYDMALITREAMKNETFRQIAGTVTYAIPKTNVQRARTITTKSEYMLQGSEEKPNKYYYPDATGVKTGSHSHSGYCFVGSASRKGVDLISVVYYTGKRARWADTIKLMEYGFSQYVSVTPIELYQMNPVTIETSGYSTSDSNRGRVQLTARARQGTVSPTIIATRSEIDQMVSNIQSTLLIQYVRDFVAPFTAGEVVGTLTYFPDSGDPVEYDLVASRSIAARENVPKTLEQIEAETAADPNPFPRFSFDLAFMFFSPPLVLFAILFYLRRFLKKKRAGAMAPPKPVNRYVK